MSPGVLVALALGAAALTVVAAPLLAPTLRSWGLVDVPNHRSSHETPTLRGGGLAPLAGVLLAAWVASVLGVMEISRTALAVCAAASLLGLLVDLREVPPLVRIVALLLLGAVLGSAMGGAGTALLAALALPVVVTVVNFMDGINGITALTCAVWGLVALLGGLAPASVALGALTLGAALGFLPWNLPRARMFLGDCGSYLFGALVTAGIVLEQAGGGRPLLLAAPLVPYLLDTGVTLVRRAVRRERLVDAHREHLYQRLSRVPGWSHAGVAGVWAGAALLVTGLWWLVGHNGAA